MGNRRKSRECAMQILYQLEAGSPPAEPRSVGDDVVTQGPVLGRVSTVDRDHAFSTFFTSFEAPDRIHELTRDLVEGVLDNLDELNALIERCCANWQLARMALVDRNVLRLCGFELCYRPDVPTVVIVSEGIEIAKKFGANDSGRFVNGVLDAMAHSQRDGDLTTPPSSRERGNR
jgi:transcription antitermination protein NusB